MDNDTTESVKSTFGRKFQLYCARNEIQLEMNECGAVMVPDVKVLTDCITTLDRYKLKLDNRVKGLQKYRSSKVSGLWTHYTPDKNTEKKIGRETTNISPRLCLANLRLGVHLYDTSAILPNYIIRSLPTDYILNTAKNGREIYEFILKETMIDTVIVNYNASIPYISSILETLQRRHKQFHYSSSLKQLNLKQKPDPELKYKCEVNMKQLQSYFSLISIKVVPLNMFGNLKNLKKIKKALFHLLKASRSKAFDLMPYIEKLDISSIKWLRGIESRKTQWLIIAKMVKWFFTGFLIKILYFQFHITSLSACINRRIYIKQSDWRYDQKKFIKKKIYSNILQPNVEYNEWAPPIGIYKLRPKYSSVRPIFIPRKHQTNEQNDLQIVFKFLKQLYITEYGLSNFQEKWKTIIEYKHNSKSDKLYLVSCDIVDAFGSIILSELYNIIESFCRKLPESLVLRWYAVKAQRYRNSGTLCSKQFFSDPNLQLPLKSGTLYAYTKHKHSRWIQKSWLLEKINKYIYSQTVQIHNKTYIIGKGIAQGTMLSPILSEIYYNFVLNKEMSTFLKSGNIIRYIDDILYGTVNEMHGKQFLQLTETGIPQYNCRFKKSKTQSNIACNGNAAMDSITYIGYKINCDTLEVEPADVTTDIRYLISFSSKHYLTPIELFKNRLYNVSSLKLSKVVLDRAINSTPTIKNILKKAFLVQAKRTRVLIQELFNDVHKDVENIVKIIKTSNRTIARCVIKIILKPEEIIKVTNVCAWSRKILSILWMCYKKIFKNDNIFGKYFIKANTN